MNEPLPCPHCDHGQVEVPLYRTPDSSTVWAKCEECDGRGFVACVGCDAPATMREDGEPFCDDCAREEAQDAA